MDELDALGRSGEDDGVIADNVAAAERRKADGARLARAGVAIAAAFRMRREVDVAPGGRGPAEEKRRARGGIDLLVVVHFDDLDVPVGQGVCRLAHEVREEINAERKIAGLDDARA